MKKFFSIITMIPLLSIGQNKVDTMYFYRGDTLTQLIRVTTSVEKPLIITSEFEKLRPYYVLKVYRNGLAGYDMAVDLFKPAAWPLGFLVGTKYKRHITHESKNQDSGIAVMVANEPTIVKEKFTLNYFFIISLVGGFILIAFFQFLFSLDFKKGKKLISWEIFGKILTTVFMIFLLDFTILLMTTDFFLGGYNPYYEMILLSTIQATSLIVMIKKAKRKQLVIN